MSLLSTPSHHRRRRNSSANTVVVEGPTSTPVTEVELVVAAEPEEPKKKTLAEEAAEPTAKNTFRLRMVEKGQASPMALLLFVLIGISAWIETNALFSELWAVAPVLPESWNLASYLVVIIQLGNVAPLVYSYLPKPPLWVAMLMVLLSSGFSMFLACGIWDITAEVFGAQHSVGLLVSAFVASMSDCLSNLVFWPYAGGFDSHPSYLAALATGESLSTAASAAVVAVQKAIGFGPRVYFAVIGCIVLFCTGAFLLLHFYYKKAAESAETLDYDDTSVTSSPSISSSANEERSLFTRESKRFIWPFLLIGWLSFVQNALTPTFLPFAGQAYPSGYLLAQNVLFACRPVASMGAAWALGMHYRSNWIVKTAEVTSVILWNLGVFITLYLSYAPVEDLPLVGQSSGTAFFTVVTVVGGATIAFTKSATMLRLKPYNKEGVLKHAGICMQFGSMVGAVTCALIANLVKPPTH
ncbi:conserved hypothetical protein [Perkinsus marinus ATCC 50983]|uniref:Equilibrative nucleoside transporter n=1 Tax=Perkinsus marinus (strain ATCC 50983 / TXsc) TaxID=423536 RepID=C5L6I2_PERM5|nr:conserved hypothetical protein [Perkinsus marinus ATCC 50983]EER07643.1 conserved hypothetical protein [Perkinsus marinus ATCC 50983]|eukprot:XP_002775827.1 conserved hypothetical protein [Perkinsus marinus ATCC 50983]